MTSTGEPIDIGLPPPTDLGPTDGAKAVDRIGAALELVAAVDAPALPGLSPTWKDRARTDLQILAVVVARLRAAVSS